MVSLALEETCIGDEERDNDLTWKIDNNITFKIEMEEFLSRVETFLSTYAKILRLITLVSVPSENT